MKLPKSYDPKQYEPAIYALWESSNSFAPTGEGEPFSVALPPPNANGNLHIGHALTVALEDALTRYHRMQGRDTIFIPGADHAGFETWVVYERELAKHGKSRFDFTREQLYGQVWDFVEKQRGNMELQLRELGASMSWDDLVFTLDKKVVNTVYDTFKKLWDEELVYRGERIVNYCTKHHTAFADIEVEHKNEKSKLWKIAYPLLDKVGEVVVATTRPETMLGDTAVAVHPDDERYKELVGKRVLLPLTDREILIIGDEAVDPTFGTGAVKVTPAHDPMDFEIGERHDLELIQVIGFDGQITKDAPGRFAGLPIEEARAKVLEELKEQDMIRGEDHYVHAVGHCYKCGTVIQPLVKDQWFLKMAPLVERAKEAIEKGEVTFTPEGRKHLMLQYLDNLRDWNLSRQIPWGIPIPAFVNVDDHEDWIFDERVQEEKITVNGKTYRRDEDTFDTWFSSGQWPYIITDYLEKGELSKYYPLSVMETGQDIMYQWVARMIMLGLYRTGQVPFRHIYLHGMVQDEHGKKMSKSRGNVINPQEVIAQFGSDALRMGLIGNRSAGQNQAFSTPKVIAARNFCNKLWNMARYIEDKVGDDYENRGPVPQSLADHWVIRQLNQANEDIQKQIADYRFAEAADTVYHTIWSDVADWYIESSKLAGSPTMLAWVLETILKLAHPFAPFVTETIWETLAWEEGQLISSRWPEKAKYHDVAASEFEQVQQLVTEIRFITSELGGEKQTLLFENDTLIHENAELIRFLSRLKSVKNTAQPRGLRLAVANREAWLGLDTETLYDHQTKLETRLVGSRSQISKLQNRLASESYVKNAPAEVVEETRTQLSEQEELEARLVRELEVLSEDTTP